ncbi:hypothetical protein EV715DRAFT_296239 [Schizophyllum commune]
MQRQPSTSKQARHVPSLEYLRSSPVRGQLEPYDGRTARGWRYLQTTDTLNQLKVLLPPRTASLYAELLKAEDVELAKAPSISWERILEIRHLKDRMVRKAQKLSPTPPPKRIGRGESFTFQTVIAPSDFRLKEMEKWLHRQGTSRPRSRSKSKVPPPPPVVRRPSQTIKQRNSFCCAHCSGIATPQVGEGLHHSAPRTGVRIPEPEVVHHLPPRHHAREAVEEVQYARRPSHEEAMDAILSPLDGLDRARAFSPPPLPHPFRTTAADADTPAVAEEPAVTHEPPEPSAPQPQIQRRSSFKRQNAEFKTVSWAVDNDECDLSDYLEKTREAHASGRRSSRPRRGSRSPRASPRVRQTKTPPSPRTKPTREASAQDLRTRVTGTPSLRSRDKRAAPSPSSRVAGQLPHLHFDVNSPIPSAAGREWTEVRVVYLEQMNALRTLHEQVYSTLTRLSSETDHLSQLDSAIKKQLASLQSSFDAFEATSPRDEEEEHEEEPQVVAEEATVVEEVHIHEDAVEAEVSIEGVEEEVAAAALAAAEEMAALHIGDD